MQQHAVQSFGHVRKDLAQVDDPVAGDQAEIGRGEPVQHHLPQGGLILDGFRGMIPPAHQVGEDVAQFEQVEGERPLRQVEVVVEIDPVQLAGGPLDKHVVAPDVAVPESLFVKKADRSHGRQEAGENVREFGEQILFVGQPAALDDLVQPVTVHRLDHPHQVARLVEQQFPLHEMRPTADKLEDARLLFRAAVAGNGVAAQADVKGLVKHQFDDIRRAAGEILHLGHPLLDLLVDPEPPLLGVGGDQEVPVLHQEDVAVVDGGEIRGVGIHPRSAPQTAGDPVVPQGRGDGRRQNRRVVADSHLSRPPRRRRPGRCGPGRWKWSRREIPRPWECRACPPRWCRSAPGPACREWPR